MGVKTAAKAVNITGSRGSFKQIGPTLNKLSAVLWAPRNRMSKFQLLHEYAKARTGIGEQMHPIAARELTRGLERVVGVNAALLALAAGTGAAIVDTDPTSTDFARFKFGNTTVDPWFGLQPIIRDVARSVLGVQKTSSGRVSKTSFADQLGQYLASGVAPGINLAYEQSTNKTLGGYDKDRLQSLRESVTPMVADAIAQQLQANGLLEAAGVGVSEFVGENTNLYQPKTKNGSSTSSSSKKKKKHSW